MDRSPARQDLPLDREDISLDWLARYDWLAVRETSRYAHLVPGGRDDLLQECRVALLRAADKFDPALGSFTAYAATAIGHAARKFVTAEHRRGMRGVLPDYPPPRVASVAPDSGGAKPLIELIADETERPLEWEQDRWKVVFGCLSEMQERVVRMRVFDNLSFREVGEALGFRESRATFLFYQAMRRLRESRKAVD